MTTMSADAKFWDGIAEKYAASPVGDPDAFERKKAVTRDHLTPESTVLEIGCGTGTLSLEMARHAGHIHAMDISAEMIRIADGKKAAQGTTNVTFHHGTLDQASPFDPEQFDAVWAYSILHLVDDRRRTLRALFELLKPGGTFISSNVCLRGGWIPYGAFITVMRWFGKAPFVHLYDRDTILREMREAGFVNVEERDVGADRRVAFIVAQRPPAAAAV
jgi:arsenite methyltransferase